jgi:putative tryptophan/tyrosine transport system substrate-binding protein
MPLGKAMRRRDFIAGIAALGVAWPLDARAQQSLMPTVGFISVRTPEFDAALVAAVNEGLRETGYVEGKNLSVEFRWAGGQFDRLPALAEDLVRKQVAVIITTGGTAAARAAKAATSTIPIVFSVGDDPVQFGLVSSLNRPGGNLTGATNFYGELAAKQITLLRELVPRALLIGVLVNPNEPASESQINDAQSAARSLSQQLIILKAKTEREINDAFAMLLRQGANALLLGANPFFVTQIKQLTALAARDRMPTMYWRPELVNAGGLISYGANPLEMYFSIGRYVGKILNGSKPGDLPIQQPTKFELAINLKTAKALGITIPPALLATADEVIE